ncbi:MAG: hypothetical protein NVS9B15_11090 [Acidobacteriaceae bacterium]
MFPTLVVSAVAGLLTGSIIVFVAPRVVSYRLQEPPATPNAWILLPIAGARLARYRPIGSASFETLMAAIFLGLAWRYGSGVRLPLSAAYSAILLTIAYIDLDHRLVLNRLSYPGILAALAASWVWPGVGLVDALLGAIIALAVFGVFELIGKGRLGTGDTKLAILIGAMRGLHGVLGALCLGVVLGGLGGLFHLVALRRGRKQYMAYAPYLSAGAVLSFFLTAP